MIILAVTGFVNIVTQICIRRILLILVDPVSFFGHFYMDGSPLDDIIKSPRFPQRPVKRRFDVYLVLAWTIMEKKQSSGWWFDKQWRSYESILMIAMIAIIYPGKYSGIKSTKNVCNSGEISSKLTTMTIICINVSFVSFGFQYICIFLNLYIIHQNTDCITDSHTW